MWESTMLLWVALYGKHQTETEYSLSAPEPAEARRREKNRHGEMRRSDNRIPTVMSFFRRGERTVRRACRLPMKRAGRR